MYVDIVISNVFNLNKHFFFSFFFLTGHYAYLPNPAYFVSAALYTLECCSTPNQKSEAIVACDIMLFLLITYQLSPENCSMLYNYDDLYAAYAVTCIVLQAEHWSFIWWPPLEHVTVYMDYGGIARRNSMHSTVCATVTATDCGVDKFKLVICKTVLGFTLCAWERKALHSNSWVQWDPFQFNK